MNSPRKEETGDFERKARSTRPRGSVRWYLCRYVKQRFQLALVHQVGDLWIMATKP